MPAGHNHGAPLRHARGARGHRRRPRRHHLATEPQFSGLPGELLWRFDSGSSGIPGPGGGSVAALSHHAAQVGVNTPKDWASNKDCTNITGTNPGDCHNGRAKPRPYFIVPFCQSA